MSRHHPACPERAHHHPLRGAVVHPLFALPGSRRWIHINGFVVWLEREPILCASEIMAERLVELLNTHGLADVPQCVPDALTWAPPCADGRLVDWRLPEDPRQRGLEA